MHLEQYDFIAAIIGSLIGFIIVNKFYEWFLQKPETECPWCHQTQNKKLNFWFYMFVGSVGVLWLKSICCDIF